MNESDREEYRLAALASGLEIEIKEVTLASPLSSTGTYKTEFAYVRYGGLVREWNPKTKKADSFDLMVDCNIIGGFSKIEQKAMAVHPYSWVECEAGGHDAAADDLMQAIFNCAVAIGRSMEQSQ